MLKIIRYSIFKLIYGKVTKIIKPKNNKKITLKKIPLISPGTYNFYSILKGRIFSDTVNNTAYILDNCLIKDASYQYKLKKNLQIINGNVIDNFVIKHGTPKILNTIKGSVFSMLSGGAAKNNYWHWIFDVLPKIGMIEKLKLKHKPDYYLLPSLKRKYQKETLLDLKIPEKKLLDGEKYKHIKCNQLLTVDHPYVFKNNPSKSIVNIPVWIIKWLRKKYIKNQPKKFKYFKKIYINRDDDSILQNRRIVNNKEVKNLLKNLGFQIISLSSFSFKDQVKIFNSANFIIGLHGAGFANLVFSRPNTKVIELTSKHGGNVLHYLAKKCQLDYKKIVDSSPQSFKHQDNPIMIDLKKLKKLILSFN